MGMDRKRAVVAQFIKSAYNISPHKRIHGKVKLEKFVCFAELERGLNTGFNFQPNQYGLYDEKVIKSAKELEKEGLIQIKPKKQEYSSTIFAAKPKLLETSTGLAEKEIRIIENTIREYWRKTNKELSIYCKQMHIHKNKTRADKELKRFRLEGDNKPLEELKKANNMPEWWKNVPAK